MQNPSGHQEIFERGEVYVPEECYVVETPLGLMFVVESGEDLKRLRDPLSRDQASIGGFACGGLQRFSDTHSEQQVPLFVVRGGVSKEDSSRIWIDTNVEKHELNHHINMLVPGEIEGSVDKMLRRPGSLESQVPGFEGAAVSIISETLSYYIDGHSEAEFLGIMTNENGLYKFNGIDIASEQYKQLLQEGFRVLQQLEQQYQGSRMTQSELRFFVAGMVSAKSIGEWDAISRLKSRCDAQGKSAG
jgi:hypothetical protein